MSEKTQKTFDLKVFNPLDLRTKYFALLAPILQLTEAEIEILAYIAPNKSFGIEDRKKILEESNLTSSASLSVFLKSLCDKGALKRVGRGKYEVDSLFLPESINELSSVTFRFVWQTSSIPT